ncbi:S-layer homology domain-containing protein [Paenibacillus sp. FA6]|uniref:S-layer homology domain-containing protein n=1 Tax=Paenibacillus sp. FA6 TaxID=3413029 RepID=UPI003F65D140
MQRIKKPFIWMLLLTLLVSIVQPGGMPTASAANVATSYFTPDIGALKDTVALTLRPEAKPGGTFSEIISRDNVYHVTDSDLTITGTFTKVTGSSLGVNIQQLNWVPKDSVWTEDPTHVTPGLMQLDVDRPDNRFSAKATLYPGMNKVTFSGSQGLNDRSETFYVLFDQVPYVEKLMILGGADKLNLNEGAQVVVPTDEITLEGKALNATKVTVAVNGKAALATSLLQDGTFFTPQLQLEPGVNDLKLIVQNASDTLTFNYSLYYYDEKNPIVGLYLVGTDNIAQSVLNVVPTYTENTTNAKIYAQMLVQDNLNTPFDGSAIIGLKTGTTNATINLKFYEGITIDSAGKLTTVPGAEIFIPGITQNTPSYRLVTFEVDPLDFELEADGTTVVKDQRHTLSVTYGTKTISKRIDFQYMQGQTVIKDLKYLKGYDETKPSVIPAGEALNGAKLDSSDFYIMVTTNSKPSNVQLIANYLPLATEAISVSTVVHTVSDTQYIYKITGFKNGNQTVRFKYTGSDSYKDATISFASKSYIYIANLSDGQTYTIDSGATNLLSVQGEYVDFDTLNSQYFLGEVFVNGLKVRSSSDATLGEWLITENAKYNGKFIFDLEVSAEKGPLVFGENRIIFTGTGTDTDGKTREVKKELRIYIVDQNVSAITNFQPAVGKDRVTFPPRDFASDNEQLPKIFNLTPDFIYKDYKYTTSLKTYDLVLRGSGAIKANLNLGTKNILSVDIPSVSTGNVTVTPSGKYNYDFAGNQKDFIMRIHDLVTDMPGTHVYTLELINETGAKTSQRLELVREESSYRLISPQPTVGNQYVVNKNFVHFDIEAEGATSVIIDKEEAVKRPDLGDNRFVLDYVGLKQDKSTKIKIQIIRGAVTNTDTIEVFYTGTVAVDAQYMAPKVNTKYSVFNKKLELSFPKGTVMQSKDVRGINKYYPETKLLFGIAEPITGVVERRNDYGNIIGFPGTGEVSGAISWSIPDELLMNFGSTVKTKNFGDVSDVYWISGGLGELGDRTSVGYLPATNGLAPYSVDALFGDRQTPAERKITPSQRGTLTLAYNANVVDEAGYTITVFRYNANRQWENIGGVVDSKKHTVSVPFDEFGYYKVMKMSRGYSDITNHQWARNVLNALYAKGFMNNLRFEQFGSDDQTTRGEFATLLVKGLSLPLNYDGKQTFADLVPGASSTTWDYAHIETATRAGIVTGLTDGIFAPDQPITREQAAVMIARALKLKLAVTDQKLKDNVAKSFLDSGKIDAYALASIEAVTKAGIMSGSAVTAAGQKKPSYNFNPKSNMTRAEAAKIAVELLKKSTKIFPKNLS